jgi:hypothetical protein
MTTETKKPAPEEVLDADMVAAAKASAERMNQFREEAPKAGVGVRRKRGGGRGSGSEFFESDIPYPVEQHGEDFELYTSSGMAAKIPVGVEITAYSDDQEFIIDPEMVRHLMFQKPGRNLPKKRLYTVKALHKDGRLVQLPFEAQIQNNAGGDPGDAIGLRRYQRKGILVFIDFDTLIPVYCAALGCFAAATQDGQYVGFCTLKHAKHTLPNQYKDAGTIASSIFGENATTSRTWEM